jgi:predicted O-methyltransferase YrrM
LHEAAALFDRIRGEIIIEVGTGMHGEMAGNSMLVWIERTRAKRIIAIDLDQERLDEVKAATRRYSHVELVMADGIEYLKSFPGKIDLLYLDFWVSDPEGALPGSGRAEAYLRAFDAARSRMNRHSLILIDDTDHIDPWKHTLIVPSARMHGYKVMHTGRQTLLKR